MTVDVTLQALADPTRRAICQRLAHGRASIGQLAALFPISRPAVSQHVRILAEAGLVQTGDGRQRPVPVCRPRRCCSSRTGFPA